MKIPLILLLILLPLKLFSQQTDSSYAAEAKISKQHYLKLTKRNLIIGAGSIAAAELLINLNRNDQFFSGALVGLSCGEFISAGVNLLKSTKKPRKIKDDIKQSKIDSTIESVTQTFPLKTLSMNVTGVLFNDFSLFYEVQPNEHHRKGISLGYMVAGRWWKGIEVDDDVIPIGAYNGPELRIYFETLKTLSNKIFSHGPEILLKYIYYTNYNFVDWFSHDDAFPVYFTRSERTFVLGAEYLLEKRKYKSEGFSETFWGFGFRFKFRNINTTDNSSFEGAYVAQNNRPIGKKFVIMFIPTINFGIKLGGALVKK